MQPLAAYQRRIVIVLLVVILVILTLKIVDRQRRAVGFDIKGFLDGYKYTTKIDSSQKAVVLTSEVYEKVKNDSLNKEFIAATDLKINVNYADIIDLQRLPGIGPVLAKRIVDYRDSVGHFNTSDDLLKVKGIGDIKLDKMKEYIEF